jgi:hypothetical protein
MANGVRRNVAKVSHAERDKLRDAIVALDGMNYPDSVSFWHKQDDPLPTPPTEQGR